jgi:putative spermidine/putrescine transport system substrate-binding protein
MAGSPRSVWRHVAAGVLLVALVAVVGFVIGCGSSDSSSSSSSAGTHPTVVVAGFGGALGEAEKAAYLDPWVKNGGSVQQLDVEASLAAVQQQVESGKVLWDIVELAGPDMNTGAAQGILIKMDPAVVDKADAWTYGDVSGVMEYGVDSNHYTEGIGYMASKYETPPTWQDFFDLKKYPGRRAMEKYIQDGTLEYAQLGAGVPKDQLYPLDYNAAIDQLKTMGDNIVWVDSLAQASQLLISGDIVMTQTAAGRMLALQKAGLDVAYNPVGQTGGSYWCIPKGAPHADEAMKMLGYIAATPECSTTMANLTGYAGPNAAGNDAATGMGAAFLFTNPEVNALGFPVDLSWWTPENTTLATNAFNDYLAGQ